MWSTDSSTLSKTLSNSNSQTSSLLFSRMDKEEFEFQDSDGEDYTGVDADELKEESVISEPNVTIEKLAL